MAVNTQLSMKPVVMWSIGLHGTSATDSLDNFRQGFLLSRLWFFHLVHHSNLSMKQEPWTKNTSPKYMTVIVAVKSLSHVWLFGPHGLKHSRLPCPPPSPRVCSSSCPLSRWFYLAVSSSVTLFSFCLQSFPASVPFPMNQLLDIWLLPI